MKIVFLNIYQGIAQRGAERSTQELATRLSARHSVTLIQAGPDNKSGKYRTISIPILFPDWPDTSLGFLRKFYLDIWSLQILFFTLISVPRLLSMQYDILSPVNGGWQTVICKLVSVIKKSKLVIIGRAGIGRDDAFNLILKPDLFIALTKRGSVWAKKINPKVNSFVLPNGVDLKKFKPAASKIKKDLKTPIIVAAASLTANKKLDLTIKAVSAMKTKVSLLILGKGPLFNKIQNLGESLIGKSRFKIMTVNSEEMVNFYNAAEIFTLPSVEQEAFGNVYLEAMACNIPVVAPVGYRREIIGNAGLYFRPDDTVDYTAKLDFALKKNFADLPRTRAGHFSWDKIFPKYETALLSLQEK